jgi:hypothetical protein
MSALSMLQGLIGRPLPRRIVNTVVGRYAQRRVSSLNRESAAEAQQRTLVRLLRQGRRTRFGREHDFARIRTVADYQAHVPLREYEAFWKDYWQPAFPLWTTSPGRARFRTSR